MFWPHLQKCYMFECAWPCTLIPVSTTVLLCKICTVENKLNWHYYLIFVVFFSLLNSVGGKFNIKCDVYDKCAGMSKTQTQPDTFRANTRFSHMCRFQMASKRQRLLPTSHTHIYKVMTHLWDPPDQVSCYYQKQSIKKKAKSNTGGGEGFTERNKFTPLIIRGKMERSLWWHQSNAKSNCTSSLTHPLHWRWTS